MTEWISPCLPSLSRVENCLYPDSQNCSCGYQNDCVSIKSLEKTSKMTPARTQSSRTLSRTVMRANWVSRRLSLYKPYWACCHVILGCMVWSVWSRWLGNMSPSGTFIYLRVFVYSVKLSANSRILWWGAGWITTSFIKLCSISSVTLWVPYYLSDPTLVKVRLVIYPSFQFTDSNWSLAYRVSLIAMVNNANE